MRAYAAPIQGHSVTSDRAGGGPTDRTAQCPGCGGRNAPDASECEWCARPFGGGTGRARPWWPLAAGILLTLVLVTVLGLAALSLTSPDADTRRVLAGTPVPGYTPPPAGPSPVTRRTPLPRSSQVEIANTGGQGASLRREPSAQAERLEVLPERATARIVGPEVLEDDSAWVEVQVESGQRGWVQSDFVRPIGSGGGAAG